MTRDELVGIWMVASAVPLMIVLIFIGMVVDDLRSKRKRSGCPGCKRSSRKRNAYCVDCLAEAEDRFWKDWERTEER